MVHLGLTVGTVEELLELVGAASSFVDCTFAGGHFDGLQVERLHIQNSSMQDADFLEMTCVGQVP